MVDSTNPRIMADNIRDLNARMISNDVEGNPSGSGFNTLLTKIKIDGKKYKLPNQVDANPTGETSGALDKVSIGGSIYEIPNSGIIFDTLMSDEFTYNDNDKVYTKSYTIPEGKEIIGITTYTLNSANILGVRWNSGTGILTVKSSPNFSSDAFTFVVTIILK